MTDSTGFFTVSVRKPKIRFLEPNLIYARLLLWYTFAYTVAFGGGCLMFHWLNVKESQTFNIRIESYFSKSIFSADNVYDFLEAFVSTCQKDLSHIVLLFAAGFTLFAGLAVFTLLSFRGFALGFSASYFVYAIRTQCISLAHPKLSLCIYSVICATVAAVMLHSAVKSVMFSDAFKALGGRPRKILCSKELYRHVFRLLIGLGATLLLNFIRYVV